MALDIPLCRIIKGQKTMLFFGPKICNIERSNIKAASTTSSIKHHLKKEILSKLQNFIDFIFIIITIIIIITITITLCFNFLKVDFFYYIISLRSYL